MVVRIGYNHKIFYFLTKICSEYFSYNFGIVTLLLKISLLILIATSFKQSTLRPSLNEEAFFHLSFTKDKLNWDKIKKQGKNHFGFVCSNLNYAIFGNNVSQ